MKKFKKICLILLACTILLSGCGGTVLTADSYDNPDLSLPYGSIIKDSDISNVTDALHDAADLAGDTLSDASDKVKSYKDTADKVNDAADKLSDAVGAGADKVAGLAENATDALSSGGGKTGTDDKNAYNDSTVSSSPPSNTDSDTSHVEGIDASLAPADYTADPRLKLSSIPAYTGEAAVAVNGNNPFFSSEDKKNTNAWEYYGALDNLGRVSVTFSNVCTALMPEDERGDISGVKPTGWHQNFYDFIDNGGALYNRMHMQAFMLTGENANEKNLVTGTRYCNESMLVYETQVQEYVYETGNHVLYRVSPVFDGDNLLASGILMEAYSVEDSGKLSFCVFVFNVEPGVTIDYATGENKAS